MTIISLVSPSWKAFVPEYFIYWFEKIRRTLNSHKFVEIWYMAACACMRPIEITIYRYFLQIDIGQFVKPITMEHDNGCHSCDRNLQFSVSHAFAVVGWKWIYLFDRFFLVVVVVVLCLFGSNFETLHEICCPIPPHEFLSFLLQLTYMHVTSIHNNIRPAERISLQFEWISQMSDYWHTLTHFDKFLIVCFKATSVRYHISLSLYGLCTPFSFHFECEI